jgi:hypothetical protein
MLRIRCSRWAGFGVHDGPENAYISNAAWEHGIKLEVVKIPEVKRAIVLLPRRWVASEVSAGCHAFVEWRGIMSDCLKF